MKNNQKIKVLQVFGSLNRGGAECRMMDVYRHIDLKECQFDFVSLSQDEQDFEGEIRSMGGEIYKLQSPRESGIVKHIKDLRQCIRQGDYDAVHAHTSYHCGLVMLAAWLEHVPVRIAHARTTGSKQNGSLKKIFLCFGRSLINQFANVRLAISEDAGLFLFRTYKFQIIPNAIDMKIYQNISDADISRLKKELSIPEKCFVIGQIGRFDSMKNHRFTVEWFTRYSSVHPEALLVFVGDGKLRSEIEKEVHERHLDDKVRFTGVRNDVNLLIHVFDVLFFPSLFEGLGGVVLEAQAAGIPCVESDTIPSETDLGLGITLRTSLQAPLDQWSLQVERSKAIYIPSQQEISNAFNSAGYSIESVTDRYVSLYRGG